ncbi:nusa protein [hydrocarbon metagenome]|uniref:Nusa protein n=1 Tax=hydrocarbon metagenome TaxID=938273 RepID=A0A0W8FJG0_9ZZZZ
MIDELMANERNVTEVKGGVSSGQKEGDFTPALPMNRTLCFKERRYIEELRILTRATALDCIIDDRFDRIIYVIRQGDMGLAIGKKGNNTRKMQKVLGKRIEMVEYSSDPEQFIRNIFRPAEIVAVQRAENNRINVYVGKRSDLGIAIGKGGCTIEKARLLSNRLFGLDLGDVLVAGEKDA